jgi:hypothetical protein
MTKEVAWFVIRTIPSFASPGEMVCYCEQLMIHRQIVIVDGQCMQQWVAIER